MMYALSECTMPLHESRESLMNNRKSVKKFVQNHAFQSVLCTLEFEKLGVNSIPGWSGAKKRGGRGYSRLLTQDAAACKTAAQQASTAAAAVRLQAHACRLIMDVVGCVTAATQAATAEDVDMGENQRALSDAALPRDSTVVDAAAAVSGQKQQLTTVCTGADAAADSPADEAMGADASAATVSGQEQQLSVGADADNEVIAFVLCKFV